MGAGGYRLLADAVLLLHAAVVAFIVGGLAAVPLGARLGWRWVRSWSFRVAHLGAIAFVVLQSWLGQLCPLTTLESWLRERDGAPGYEASFIEHWVRAVLFHDLPFEAFVLAYTAFGALVVLAWLRYPPRPRTPGSPML